MRAGGPVRESGVVLLTGYLGGAVPTQVLVGNPILSHVLFPVYVAVMLRLVSLRLVPFVTAFVIYFIALYAMQALFLRRLVTPVK